MCFRAARSVSPGLVSSHGVGGKIGNKQTLGRLDLWEPNNGWLNRWGLMGSVHFMALLSAGYKGLNNSPGAGDLKSKILL